MFLFNQPRPLFHLGKIPISVVGLIILVELIGMVAWALSGGTLINLTAFTPQSFLDGDIWRLFTFPMVSPLGIMSLLGLFFFYQFGTTVEAAIERKQFVLLCLSVLFVGPIVLLGMNLLGVPDRGTALFGTQVLSLAMFCSFCVMHPNLPFFLFRIPIKWIGLIFFALSVLGSIGGQMVDMALAYTLGTGLAIWMIQSKGLALLKIFPDGMTLSPSVKKKAPKKKTNLKAYRPKRSERNSPKPVESKIVPKVSVPDDTEIDTILDKISAEGLHSLTVEERAKLESISKK